MRYFTITLEAVGPVHIGSGKEISKKECLYVPQEKKIYIMDEKKMFAGILRLGLEEKFTGYLMDDSQKNLMMFVKNNMISPAEYKSWAAYVLNDDNAGNVSDSRSKGGGSDNVQAFMKDAYGCPYIPGSSLKGALRTIIQGCLLYDNYESFSEERRNIETEFYKSRKRYLSDTEKRISQKLFYTLERPGSKSANAVNDIFSGIRVSDSAPLSVDDLILCRKTDMLPDGKINSISIKRECLRPGTKITFDMEIDESIFNTDNIKLLGCIDDFLDIYRSNYLEEFPGEARYDAKKGEHLIYLGGGVGYAAKTTVYPLYDDIDKAVKTVQNIMVNTTSTSKKHDPHHHSDDLRRYDVSPHTLKIAVIKGKKYEMGLCRVDISVK